MAPLNRLQGVMCNLGYYHIKDDVHFDPSKVYSSIKQRSGSKAPTYKNDASLLSNVNRLQQFYTK
ncbi:hypothetical protein WN55_06222 [Dufourea novaeangliae]|uniref:Uncharacterized protein n=1 Tax=Dufourea novaeangliae TaxID=178035 RepID=A0A154PQ32_DUFNO|nr:hypothetical protein WN55_06222 [Dufourea novaeangliae]